MIIRRTLVSITGMRNVTSCHSIVPPSENWVCSKGFLSKVHKQLSFVARRNRQIVVLTSRSTATQNYFTFNIILASFFRIWAKLNKQSSYLIREAMWCVSDYGTWQPNTISPDWLMHARATLPFPTHGKQEKTFCNKAESLWLQNSRKIFPHKRTHCQRDAQLIARCWINSVANREPETSPETRRCWGRCSVTLLHWSAVLAYSSYHAVVCSLRLCYEIKKKLRSIPANKSSFPKEQSTEKTCNETEIKTFWYPMTTDSLDRSWVGDVCQQNVRPNPHWTRGANASK